MNNFHIMKMLKFIVVLGTDIKDTKRLSDIFPVKLCIWTEIVI